MDSNIEKAAASILTRAVTFENENRLTQALTCYQEGVQLLIEVLKGCEGEKKKHLSEKVDEYLTHGEKLKKKINDLKNAGRFHEQIKISDNAIGYSYDSLFGRFLDESINHILIEDSYIRIHHQFQNLVKFCELVIKKRGINCQRPCTINLATTRDSNIDQQDRNFNEISFNLKSFNISLSVEFRPTLHDRQITLSNGYIIKIGRGLDIYKASHGKLTVGTFDMDLRQCHETTVDIFHTKDVKIVKS